MKPERVCPLSEVERVASLRRLLVSPSLFRVAMARERDLFPLPEGVTKSPACRNSAVSRCVARRRQALTHSASIFDDSVHALNLLNGDSPVDSSRSATNITAAQQRALDDLRGSAVSLGPPPSDLPTKGALGALLGDSCYGIGNSTVAPLDIDRLALTSSGFKPVPLSVLDERLGLDSVSWLRSKLLPSRDKKDS